MSKQVQFAENAPFLCASPGRYSRGPSPSASDFTFARAVGRPLFPRGLALGCPAVAQNRPRMRRKGAGGAIPYSRVRVTLRVT